MSKILVVGASEDWIQGLQTEQTGSRPRMNVTREDWRAIKPRPARRVSAVLADADVVIADLTAPGAYTARGLANLKRAYPRLSLVVRTDAELSSSEAMNHLLDSPGVDFIRSSADTDEVRLRIRRLLNRRTHQETPPASERLTRQLMPELHHPGNGRLDARRIADYFSIPLADIARVLSISLSRLHKTPAAPSAQEGLYLFERIALALYVLTGTKEATRAWFRLPLSALTGKTPFEVLLEGKGHVVAEMLDDMLVGQPS